MQTPSAVALRHCRLNDNITDVDCSFVFPLNRRINYLDPCGLPPLSHALRRFVTKWGLVREVLGVIGVPVFFVALFGQLLCGRV